MANEQVQLCVCVWLSLSMCAAKFDFQFSFSDLPHTRVWLFSFFFLCCCCCFFFRLCSSKLHAFELPQNHSIYMRAAALRGLGWEVDWGLGDSQNRQLILGHTLTSDQHHRWQIRGDTIVILVIQSLQIDLLLTIVDACN